MRVGGFRRLSALVVVSLAASTTIVSVASPPVSAAGPYTVDTTTDTLDADIGDGVCTDIDGDCSLRAAIQEANADPADDTITLPSAATLTLTIDGPEPTDPSLAGDLDVQTDLGALTIVGNGSTIDASAIGDRVFEAVDVDGTEALTLTDLTVTGGTATEVDTQNGPSTAGGGVLANGAHVMLDGVTITANSATFGGGAAAVAGSIEIVDSTINTNTATDGGGIAVDSAPSTITTSTVSGNTAAGDGGGLHIIGVEPATLTGSTIDTNTATVNGGGIYTSGDLTIDLGDILDNDANGTSEDQGGGGVFVDIGGDTTVLRTTIANNNANFGCPAIVFPLDSRCFQPNSGGGVLSLEGSNVTVEQSTVTNNEGVVGGGLVLWGTGSVTTSTVVSNRARDDTGVGGVLSASGVSIDASTVINNVRPYWSDLFGWAFSSSDLLTYDSMIVSRSIVWRCNSDDAETYPTSGGHNKASSSCGFAHATDLEGWTTLGPLQDNGGPTETMLPSIEPQSEVIDASTCVPGEVDQRGVPRPHGATCDIGAVEVDTFLSVLTTADTVDVAPGDGDCADVNGDCSLRAAVQETNARPGADLVVLPSGLYGLTITGAGEDAAATGDLDITDDLLIRGDAGVVVDANGLDRAFHILSGTVEIRSAEITDGDAGTQPGGAVLNEAGATVELEDIDAHDNRGAVGGAIAAAGPLTLRDSAISVNEAGIGGGVAATGALSLWASEVRLNEAEIGGGVAAANAVYFDGTTIDENEATAGAGGGVLLIGTGSAAFADTQITDNSALTYGGGIATVRATSLLRTFVGRNTGANGGGIFASGSGTISIRISMLHENHATEGLGGGLASEAPIDMWGSTVDSNTATVGGGILSTGALSVDRSAVVNNDATQGGGGIAAVASGGDTVTLVNATVSQNSAVAGGGLLLAAPTSLDSVTITRGNAVAGGGMYLLAPGDLDTPGATLLVTNSIIADQLTGGDCGGTGPITSAGYNLDSTDTCSLDEPTDLPDNPYALLGELRRSGSNCQTEYCTTHTPASDSAALNTGSTTQPHDQGGTPRPANLHDDRGAVEVRSHSDDIAVTATHDAVDANPGDGVCRTAGPPGECTLRAAIQTANNRTNRPTVILEPGQTYTLSLAGSNENAGASGDLDVTDDVVIRGAGATIDGDGLDRVLDIHTGASASLQTVTITGGSAPAGEHGGGIRNAGGISVSNSSITDSRTANAPGISSATHGGGLVNTGTASIRGTTVSGNRAGNGGNVTTGTGGAGGHGGGIANFNAMTISTSTITNNQAGNGGSATNGNGGRGGHGGGIYNSGTIYTVSDLGFWNSTIEGNTSGNGGSAPDVSPRRGGDGGRGGGIYSHSTFETRINYTTFDHNELGQAGTGFIDGTSPAGSAIYSLAGNFHIRNSIIGDLADPDPDLDFGLCNGSVTSLGYNLVETTDSSVEPPCSFTAEGDQVDIDPLLGDLADNGGRTKTILPSSNSPALDSIPTSPSSCGSGTPTDQRGEPRPINGACDKGSVERS